MIKISLMLWCLIACGVHVKFLGLYQFFLSKFELNFLLPSTCDGKLVEGGIWSGSYVLYMLEWLHEVITRTFFLALVYFPIAPAIQFPPLNFPFVSDFFSMLPTNPMVHNPSKRSFSLFWLNEQLLQQICDEFLYALDFYPFSPER